MEILVPVYLYLVKNIEVGPDRLHLGATIDKKKDFRSVFSFAGWVLLFSCCCARWRDFIYVHST